MALRHIMAATDFSHRAIRAVSRAAMLASEHQATLDLLHVTRTLPTEEPEPTLGGSREDLQRQLLEDIETQMAQQIQSVHERYQVEAVPQIATGKPYFEIPRLAAERQADLVVIGAHGEHFFYDLFLGSTVEKVLQSMAQPLLIAKQRPMGPYRHILVPLDFSPVSEVAIAVTAAYFPEATVSVLHAYELFFERKLISAEIADSALAEYRQQAEAEALRQLTHLVGAHLPSPARVALYAKQGHPANVIRTMAEDLEPDLILMGKNEHSVLEKLLIGSITKHVLHEINGDVLIVTPV
jgi:nucleotide-binding universal stress UspA family protein